MGPSTKSDHDSRDILGSVLFARVAVALLAICATTTACGNPARETAPVEVAASIDPTPNDWEPGMTGHWMRAHRDASVSPEIAAELETLGYAPGYQAAPLLTGVTVHDPARAQGGVNLYCSGHDTAAHLVDMSGVLLHTWRLAYDQVPNTIPNPHPWFSGSWRRVRMLDDGSLLAIYENLGLAKVDLKSRLLRWYDGKAHHDLDVLPDGTIYVLTRQRRNRPLLNRRHPVIEDFVTVLSPDGVEKRSISILDAFLRSDEYRSLVGQLTRPHGDLFHTNTIEVLDHRLAMHGERFRPGNVLLSIRHLDTIAVLDPDSETIVWAATGPWRWQHEPVPLDNGNLLLFDNQGLGRASRVLELNPPTCDIVWSYQGDPPESFYSVFCGAESRMPNGNTLIVETCAGRAFEITASGEIVWEFVSPHRAGDHGELVAALFDLISLPERPAWLEMPTERAPTEAGASRLR